MISAAPDPVEHFIWLFGWSKFDQHASQVAILKVTIFKALL